ncbi:MAG: hypothetical protein WC716_11730 [Chitinophagaceae bacterium]|jgi:hypothetical protein
MNASDLENVYGALLSSPGMNEAVKIDLKISRRVVLLLSQVIEKGLIAKGDEATFGMKDVASKEELEELQKLSTDCLEKAGMTELNGKLSALTAK